MENRQTRASARILFTVIFAVLIGGISPSTDRIAHAAHLKDDKSIAIPTDPLTSATVNLYCSIKVKRKTYSMSGSGVFISERGVILTNAHVAQYFLLAGEDSPVQADCTVRTGSPAKDTYYADVLYFPQTWIVKNATSIANGAISGTGENDFALLYVIDAKNGDLPAKFPILPFDIAKTIVEPEVVRLAGYPTERLNYDKIRKKLKFVAASSTIENTQGFSWSPGPKRQVDMLAIAPSAAGSSGVSGGPVMDSAGMLAGIVTNKNAAKDSRAVRALSLAYIDRSIRVQTGLSLEFILNGDFALRAKLTDDAITSDMVDLIYDGLRKRK